MTPHTPEGTGEEIERLWTTFCSEHENEDMRSFYFMTHDSFIKAATVLAERMALHSDASAVREACAGVAERAAFYWNKLGDISTETERMICKARETEAMAIRNEIRGLAIPLPTLPAASGCEADARRYSGLVGLLFERSLHFRGVGNEIQLCSNSTVLGTGAGADAAIDAALPAPPAAGEV